MNTDKKYDPNISAGNQDSDGDAREEERMDKDEDLKTDEDEQSPLAKDYDEDKSNKKIRR